MASMELTTNNERYNAYKEFIIANKEPVLKDLKNWLLFGKPIMEASIFYELKKCLDPWPTHYILENAESRMESDGKLIASGDIEETLTVEDFINEFSGNVAIRKYNDEDLCLYYTTYKEEIEIPICTMMNKIAKNGISAVLKKKFGLKNDFQDDMLLAECLIAADAYKIIDMYSVLSIIRFYQIDSLTLKNVKMVSKNHTINLSFKLH